MRKLRALGKSYDDIAEILNRGKHRTSTGARFIGASVCRILKREGFSGDSRTIRKGIANAEHAGRD
jgi:transposase